ncbi:MAG: transposase [Hormoscilla sp. SP12CHS1]|nr:transposase [Hormoscilla sp. SP12CHS1]
MTTIPGKASHSAAVLLAEIGTIGAYKNARQVAGNAGLTPVEHAICTW